MPKIDWYFDFVSPYSYLQWCRLRGSKEFAQMRPRPVLFAGLLKHWGHKGPAELPTKRRFTYRQVLWLAQRNGVRLRFPPGHPFNPIRALRLAVALDGRADAIDTIFRFIWEQGRDFNTLIEWNVLLMRLGMVNGNAAVATAHIKDTLRRTGEEAIAAGVFGVPTLVIDGELFWGLDATDMALEYLRDPGCFMSDDYARIEKLPVSAARAELSG